MKTLSFALAFSAAIGATTARSAILPDPPAAIALNGRGSQIYICEAGAEGFSWVLKGPDARLYDSRGNAVAAHFFGPRWKANDGSEILGIPQVVNAAPSSSKRDAPWLILRAVVLHGGGIFAHVSTVIRSETHGGGAPAVTCDAQEDEKSVAVPYTADYTFFSS